MPVLFPITVRALRCVGGLDGACLLSDNECTQQKRQRRCNGVCTHREWRNSHHNEAHTRGNTTKLGKGGIDSLKLACVES